MKLQAFHALDQLHCRFSQRFLHKIQFSDILKLHGYSINFLHHPLNLNDTSKLLGSHENGKPNSNKKILKNCVCLSLRKHKQERNHHRKNLEKNLISIKCCETSNKIKIKKFFVANRN